MNKIKQIIIVFWINYLRFIFPFSAPEIVKFPNGEYAIRKRVAWMSFYRDFYGNYWWQKSSRHFGSCLTVDVQKLLKQFKPYEKTFNSNIFAGRPQRVRLEDLK